jgi:hypothetical protein
MVLDAAIQLYIYGTVGVETTLEGRDMHICTYVHMYLQNNIFQKGKMKLWYQVSIKEIYIYGLELQRCRSPDFVIFFL